MKHEYEALYGRVELRSLSLSDAERMRVLRNQNSSSFFNAAQITPEAQRRWYEKYLSAEGDYMFSVYLCETNQWVGAVGIYHVDQLNDRCEFGRLMIDRSAVAERGLGVDTTLAACQFAFHQLGLSTVFLEVFQDNLAAVRTYERSGFQVCGTRLEDTGKTILYMEKYRSER